MTIEQLAMGKAILDTIRDLEDMRFVATREKTVFSVELNVDGVPNRGYVVADEKLNEVLIMAAGKYFDEKIQSLQTQLADL